MATFSGQDDLFKGNTTTKAPAKPVYTETGAEQLIFDKNGIAHKEPVPGKENQQQMPVVMSEIYTPAYNSVEAAAKPVEQKKVTTNEGLPPSGMPPPVVEKVKDPTWSVGAYDPNFRYTLPKTDYEKMWNNLAGTPPEFQISQVGFVPFPPPEDVGKEMWYSHYHSASLFDAQGNPINELPTTWNDDAIKSEAPNFVQFYAYTLMNGTRIWSWKSDKVQQTTKTSVGTQNGVAVDTRQWQGYERITIANKGDWDPGQYMQNVTSETRAFMMFPSGGKFVSSEYGDQMHPYVADIIADREQQELEDKTGYAKFPEEYARLCQNDVQARMPKKTSKSEGGGWDFFGEYTTFIVLMMLVVGGVFVYKRYTSR
jgi:hypothetical protein